MNYDKIIIRHLISDKNKIRNGIMRKIKSHYPNIYSYLCSRYNDSESISETIRRIQYNIQIRPKCKVCGNKVSYLSNGLYRNVCSFKCGYVYAKDRISSTLLDRYGVDNAMKCTGIREKAKKTCIQKYGVDNPSKSDIIKQKKENTSLLHYGVNNYYKSKESVQKSHTKECILKQIETKRKNNTFNSSNEEEELYLYIKEKFPNVQRQYKDSIRYPYACDFYIPELDMFIEYNGTWTHGKHAYDYTSIEDKAVLERWKKKNTKYYNNAIKTWTIRDVEKRNKAKENNLKFKEFWTILDCKCFINNLHITLT